jgi:hypothetical protein
VGKETGSEFVQKHPGNGKSRTPNKDIYDEDDERQKGPAAYHGEGTHHVHKVML